MRRELSCANLYALTSCDDEDHEHRRKDIIHAEGVAEWVFRFLSSMVAKALI
jgi:hypothetical protein